MRKEGKSTTIGIISIIVIIVIAVIAYSYLSVDKIAEIKTSERVGDTVKVKGEVKTVIKIGELSGYTIEDSTGTIAVSSDDLPKEKDVIVVKGTLIKDTIFGYYIKEN